MNLGNFLLCDLVTQAIIQSSCVLLCTLPREQMAFDLDPQLSRKWEHVLFAAKREMYLGH